MSAYWMKPTLLALAAVLSTGRTSAIDYEPVELPLGTILNIIDGQGGLMAISLPYGPGPYAPYHLSHRIDGGSWVFVDEYDQVDRAFRAIALGSSEYIVSEVSWSNYDNCYGRGLSIRSVQTAEYLGSVYCRDCNHDPEGCMTSRVFRNDGSIYGQGPYESSPISVFEGGAWVRVTPLLLRKDYPSGGEACYVGCRIAAPVDLMARVGNTWFATGDIQEYLEQPIGDFVRTAGEDWTDLGMDHDGSILALAEYDGSMIAGGSFTTLGGIDATAIAKWTGGAWGAVAPALQGTGAIARDFVKHQEQLLFLVDYDLPEARPTELWAWNGHSAARLDIDPPGSKLLATGSELYVYGNELFYRVLGSVVANEHHSISDLKARFLGH